MRVYFGKSDERCRSVTCYGPGRNGSLRDTGSRVALDHRIVSGLIALAARRTARNAHARATELLVLTMHDGAAGRANVARHQTPVGVDFREVGVAVPVQATRHARDSPIHIRSAKALSGDERLGPAAAVAARVLGAAFVVFQAAAVVQAQAAGTGCQRVDRTGRHAAVATPAPKHLLSGMDVVGAARV